MEEHIYIPDNTITQDTDRAKTNCFGISATISQIPEVVDVKESHFMVGGYRKVVLWSDGKEYEIIIKPINHNNYE